MTAAFIAAIFAALFNTTPACEFEDGSEMVYDVEYTACTWDAGRSGNGRGDSYVVVKVPARDESGKDTGEDHLLYFYEDGHMER